MYAYLLAAWNLTILFHSQIKPACSSILTDAEKCVGISLNCYNIIDSAHMTVKYLLRYRVNPLQICLNKATLVAFRG